MTTLSPARLAREFGARYRLEGARCKDCGEVIYPARVVCPACRSRNIEPHTVSDQGEVVTFTQIHVPGSAFKAQAPFYVAVVALDGGGRLTCQLADLVDVEPAVGMRVQLEFRRIQEDGEAGVIAYGHKAVPA